MAKNKNMKATRLGDILVEKGIISSNQLKIAIDEQKRLREPSQFPENRSLFWEDYRRFGFEYVIGKKE